MGEGDANWVRDPPTLQVVCTLGPKSRDVPVLEELLRAGMSVARFNFSHGSHEYHQVCANIGPIPAIGRLIPPLR